MAVDTLIIGSGVVASALAQTLLAKNPKASILILEAGSRVKTKDYGLWEHYLITGQLPYDRYKDLQYPQNDLPGENMSVGGTDLPLAGGRAMTYGGSTIHWGGWSFRLKPEDFRLHSHTGQGVDWPIDYTLLEPYYCQAEHYIGVSGDSADSTVTRSAHYPFPAFPFTLEDAPIAEAFAKRKMTFSHLPIARHGMTDTTSKQAPCQTTGTCKYCPFGARFAATNFLNDMLAWNDYPNFAVRTETLVEEIRMSSKAVASSVLVRKGEATEIIEAQRIVIAAGTIESGKLLQRSQSLLWPKGVGNDNDMVGRHLITHPYFVFKGTAPDNPRGLQKEMDFPTLCSRHFDSPAEQKKGKFILVNPPNTIDPDLVTLMKAGKDRSALDKALSGKQTVALHGMIEVFGRHKNRVTNAPGKRNRIGLTQTIVDYTQDPLFMKRMGKVQQHVEKIYSAMGATLIDKPSISWRADHASSTCRMGDDPAISVVDKDLRVHGIDNLFICSNATFPSIGAVNPTLTLTALALRLGDQLAVGTGQRST